MRQDEIQEWIAYADSDIKAACILSNECSLDLQRIALYHLQQASEKLLKASVPIISSLFEAIRQYVPERKNHERVGCITLNRRKKNG